MSVPFFLLIFEKVFLCYFPVNLCISFSNVHLRLKLPIYSYLCRLFRMGGGRGRAIATYMVQTNLFSEKKKKIKIVDFVKYCVMELTYIVMIVCVFFFCCQKKEKKKQSYVLMYVKAVRRVIKSRHCLYILYFVLLLSVIGFDFCHFLGT